MWNVTIINRQLLILLLPTFLQRLDPGGEGRPLLLTANNATTRHRCGGGVRRRGFLQYRRSDHETEFVNMSTWFIGLRHGAMVQIIFIVVILIFIVYGIGIGDVHTTEFRWKTSCFVWKRA